MKIALVLLAASAAAIGWNSAFAVAAIMGGHADAALTCAIMALINVPAVTLLFIVLTRGVRA